MLSDEDSVVHLVRSKNLNMPDGWRWTIRDGDHEALVQNTLSALTRDPQQAGFTLIKSNPVRTVLSRSGDRPIIVKQYTVRSIAERLKYLLVPSKAAAESRGFELCVRNGIPVPEVLAWGEKRRGCFLRAASAIERRLDDAVQLSDYINDLSPTLSPDDRLALMKAAGTLLASMHRAGISHPDFHPGNVLVRAAGSGPPELFAIDLHSIRSLSLFRSRRRAKDLAKLYHALTSLAHDADLKEMLSGYFETAGGWHIPEAKIVRRARALEAQRLRSRTRRCVKESSLFTKINLYRLKGYRRRDWSNEEILSVIREHEEAKRFRDARLVKQSRRSYVTVVTASPARYTERLVVKQPALGLPLLGRRRTANVYRMRRAWLAAHAFAVRNLPAPKHLALVEKRFLFIPYRAWLISRCVEGALDLDRFLESHPNAPGAFFDQLAALILSLFRSGIYHSDLSGKNILIREAGDRSWQFYFLDLESVVLWRRLTERRKAKNVRQLYRSLKRWCDPDQRECFLRKLAPCLDERDLKLPEPAASEPLRRMDGGCSKRSP